MDLNPATWDWGVIGQTFLAAGLGSGLFQAASSYLHSRKTRHTNAAYLGLRIAVAMERFADECATIIANREMFVQSKGAAGSQTARMPAAPVFPEDTDGWRSLDPKLAERSLTFPGMVASAEGGIAFMSDHVDHEELPLICAEYCAKCGWQASQLAVAMRERYRFPEFHAWYQPELKRHFDRLASDKK